MSDLMETPTLEAQHFSEKLNQTLSPMTDKLESFVFYSINIGEHSVPLILLWLVCASLFCTFYFRFLNFRRFGHAIDLVRGKHDKAEGAGEITRFQALTTTMSGTVGLGNIAGVAVAVSIGGPGAVFWMVLMGLFGMSTKFLEASLGVKYRHDLGDGRFSGGPFHYLKDGLKAKGLKGLGIAFGAFFAICCIGGSIGAGNMFQSNQAFQQFVTITGGEQSSSFADSGWVFGVILAILVGIVIIGGVKSIANVASRIVPIMGGVYVLAGLAVILMNFTAIPAAFGEIISGAFGLEAGIGCLIGALLQGVRRAAFSNEAGTGSAGIAHAVVKTDQPVSQGIVAMIGPFIDTVVICMITALVIVITGSYGSEGNMEGVELTSRAFESAFSWFPYVLALTVFLFAFSTMISWAYYGLKATTYLFGERKSTEMIYKVLFCLFVIVGASADLGVIIRMSDSLFFLMAIPNIIGLYILAPEIKRDLKKYEQNIDNK
jgi:AGCS family alanine or glycine:cation symporter